MTVTDKKQEAWNRHWRAGHLSSLSLDNQTSEAPEALAAWEAFFGYINSGAIILDVATGNGIIPAYAQAHAKKNNKTFEVVAIDQADIDPEATLGENAGAVKGTLFIGGIEAEDLPFEDGWFDAVVGQYALEYTFADRSVPELARVLKNQGIIRFVCHAREGAIVKFNAPKAKQAAFVVEESGVFEALEAAARAAFDQTGETGRTRETFKAKVETARRRLKNMGENPELDQFLTSLVEAYIGRERFGGREKFMAWVDGVKTEVEGQIVMMAALDRAALDEAGLIALGEKLSQEGFKRLNLSKLEVGPGKELLAYVIEGMKS